MTREEIGKHIRFLRIKNNLKQQELANLTGLNRTTISEVERCRYKSTNLNTVLKILEVLNEELYITTKKQITNDIIEEAALRIEKKIISRFNSRSHYSKYGWVYIIKSDKEDDVVKIGFTNQDNPNHRLCTFENSRPDDIIYIVYYARLTSDCRKIEKQMHKNFKFNRIKGEWFKVNCEVVKKELDRIINDLDTPHLYC